MEVQMARGPQDRVGVLTCPLEAAIPCTENSMSLWEGSKATIFERAEGTDLKNTNVNISS